MAEFISYPSKAIFSIVIFVSLFIQCAFCQGTLSGIEVTNGASSLSGTPVQTNANGIPTLIYNCAKLPSICNNVNKIITLINTVTVNNADPVHNGLAGHGAIQGNDYYILHYDTNKDRHDARNTAACPGNWKNGHPCPETGNAPQPFVVPNGTSLGQSGAGGSSFRGTRFANTGGSINQIANAAGQYSGLIWTCDEFPPASTVEGGNSQPGGASTYCAPQSGLCGGNPRVTIQNGFNPKAEQDLQSSAHSSLRTKVGATQYAQGVFRFHFKTQWVDEPDVPATAVIWYDNSNANFILPFQKRTSEPTHEVTTEIYGDGIIRHVRRRLPKTETEPRAIGDIINPVLSLGNAIASGVSSVIAPIASGVSSALESIATGIITTTGGLPGTETLHNPVQQNFLVAPPLPLEKIGLENIRNSLFLKNGLSGLLGGLNTSGILGGLNATQLLRKRATGNQCSSSSPCPDGSCCNNDGFCGYGAMYCGKGNCTSNCGAMANCGKDSRGGNVSCPLNVCCSAYGYCGVESDFCLSPNKDAPCQKGFGSCSSVAAPSCGGNSASGRTVGYYQISNVNTRQCNRIKPNQIATGGYTHLNLAFATIDPSSFAVLPANDGDTGIYLDFTSLKSSSLQTWIALGGWDFSDPGPTRNTWQTLASTSANRAKFISSMQNFMSKYGFQGVDLDWEYPASADRGGTDVDTQNFVQLLKEMRAAWGTQYGISLTLPSAYWYLRGFDPKSMEQYVDFFGLMTYDLHGPWDKNIKQVGPIVEGHTNVTEIESYTKPLWYANLNPAKINFGLAYYGRGYTFASSSCKSVGCQWSGPSAAGPCTNFAGVMSLIEITSLINQLSLTPQLLQGAMMKQIVWENNWMGYDDLDTISMKKKWASGKCFGGTMAWSVDFNSGVGSGNTPDGQGSTNPGDPGSGSGQGGAVGGDGTAIVYIDPSIYSSANPVINCQPPCTFILPPLPLAKPSTLTFPLYTTSLQVAWPTSTVVTGTDGSKTTTTTFTRVVQTTTLTIPPATLTEIPAWSYVVNDTNSASTVTSSFYITSSILPTAFTITDNPNPQSKSGVSHPVNTRTIQPPPFPYSFTTPASKPSQTSTTTSSGIAAFFPIVTYKPGPPGPICKSKCGKPCQIFCDHPCLLLCPGGYPDFPDPNDPTPPPPGQNPTPTGPTQTKNDPQPTGKIDTPPPDNDPEHTDPEDTEEEEEDDQCDYAFGFDPVRAPNSDSGSGSGSGGNTGPTSSGTVDPNVPSTSTATPKDPPPSPSPSPNPTPPSPNPATESVHCFASGSIVGRGDAIKAVNGFCNDFKGATLSPSSPYKVIKNGYSADDGIVINVMSVTLLNNCQFTIDGPSANQECGRIFRRAIDECDTSSTRFKKGGTVTSNCAIWDFDPTFNTNFGFPKPCQYFGTCPTPSNQQRSLDAGMAMGGNVTEEIVEGPEVLTLARLRETRRRRGEERELKEEVWLEGK